MALGLLMIMFIVIGVLGLLSVVLLFTVKDPRKNNSVFWFTVILGIVISYIATTSLPANFNIPRIFAASMGVLAVIGIVLKVMHKTIAAKIMVTASVLLGMIQLFFF